MCDCICVYTHIESGSLSRLPRPGILKALARLFFPPSGAKAVMYSSKPTRAADSRRIDNNKTHSENILYVHRLTLCHYELFCLCNTILSVVVVIFLSFCKLLSLCVCAFISLQTLILVNNLYLASLCLSPSALQISGLDCQFRYFPHSA